MPVFASGAAASSDCHRPSMRSNTDIGLGWSICLVSIFLGLLVAAPVVSPADELLATWDGLISEDNFWQLAPQNVASPSNWNGIAPYNYPAHTGIDFFSARIGPNGAADVRFNGLLAAGLDQLTIQAGSTLTLPETADIILTNRPAGPEGLLDNAGTIFITGSDIVANADLQLDGQIRFIGGGTIEMSDGSNNRILGNNAFNFNATLVNENQTIAGSGQVGVESLSIRNQAQGVIRATDGANELVIDPGANNNVINAGLMEATSGGSLRIQQTAINNTGGVISATSPTGQVFLQDVTVSFGELAGAGLIRGIATVTLEGPITNSGNYNVPSGMTTILDGDLANSGMITIAGGSFLIDGDGGDVSLTGGGTVTLAVNASTSAFADVSNTTPTVTNVDNLIQGAGNIASQLVNQGTIRANEAAAPLVLQIKSMTNESLIEAVAGGKLDVRIDLDNTAGQVSAVNGTVEISSGGSVTGGVIDIDATSRLEMNNGRVVGGTVNNATGGVIAATQFDTNRLSGVVTNAAGGMIVVHDDQGVIFDEVGTYQNAGVIKLDGSGPFATFAATKLLLDGVVTLEGGGEVMMTNASDNVILSLAGGDDTLVNEDHLIHGAGHIGRNITGIVNRATIAADQPSTGAPETGTLSIDPNADGLTNEGTLEATGGGNLQLRNGMYNNAAGTIHAAAGSTVTIEQGVHIAGGSLATTGDGQFQINATGVTIDGIGIELDGQFNLGPLAAVRLIGQVANRQDIDLDDGAQLQIDGPVTLSGGGRLALTGPTSTVISFPGSIGDDRLINLDNTITGDGRVLFVPIENQGVLAPGNSPGGLQLADYVQVAGGWMEIELAGPTAGEFDTVSVTGVADLGGGLRVVLLPGLDVAAGTSFDFLSAGVLNENFDTLDLPTDMHGDPLLSLSQVGNTLRLTALQDLNVAVPEPAGGLLLFCGALGLLGLHRRRKKNIC